MLCLMGMPSQVILRVSHSRVSEMRGILIAGDAECDHRSGLEMEVVETIGR